MRRILLLVVVIGAVFIGACGDEKEAATPREVAETFVAALEQGDWDAACDVSVNDDRDQCVSLVSDAFSKSGQIPSVSEAENTIEEVDGRYLVHFEVAVIR